MARVHVAILKKPYLRGILDGWKTIESRLYRVAQPPVDCIAAGERLFLKVSSGPWMATAVAARVDAFRDLTPARVDAIRREFGDRIGGDDDYWQAKRGSRYAVLVHLADVEPLDVGPAYPKSMRAWHVLDDALSPLREVAVTEGAIRNGYAVFPREVGDAGPWAPPGPVVLQLPGGERVETRLGPGRRLRWRGWRGIYAAAGVRPGDVMRYVAPAPGSGPAPGGAPGGAPARGRGADPGVALRVSFRRASG